MHIGFAFKSPETHRACTAIGHIEAALATLDALPIPVLEALRDHVADQAKVHEGPEADFWHAFGTYLGNR